MPDKKQFLDCTLLIGKRLLKWKLYVDLVWFWVKVYCQTLGLVLRLRVDFILPLSQQEEQEEEEEQEQPLTKIYQKGVN